MARTKRTAYKKSHSKSAKKKPQKDAQIVDNKDSENNNANTPPPTEQPTSSVRIDLNIFIIGYVHLT
jgi:hypothetical protein